MDNPARQWGGLRGLECVTNGRRLVLALAHVDQLIEYRREPLPLGRGGIAGLGVYGEQLVLSLSLRDIPKFQREAVKGILCHVSVRRLPVALEVDETFSFVEVDLTARALSPEQPWLLEGMSSTGHTVYQLDIPAFMAAHGMAVDP